MSKKETKMQKKIMNDIKNSELQMHSKTYFRVLNLALIGVSGLFLMLSALLGLIALREIAYGDRLGLRSFGTRGYSEFLQTLPWLAIIFGLLTFLIAYTLVKHFDFTYKHRFYTIVGALIFAVAALGIIFASTGLEGALSKTGPFEGLRTFSRFSQEHSITGEVVDVQESTVIILSDEGETVEIQLSENYRGLRMGYQIQIGDTVFAIGNRNGDTFEAYGMRKGFRPLPPHTKGVNRRIMK